MDKKIQKKHTNVILQTEHDIGRINTHAIAHDSFLIFLIHFPLPERKHFAHT